MRRWLPWCGSPFVCPAVLVGPAAILLGQFSTPRNRKITARLLAGLLWICMFAGLCHLVPIVPRATLRQFNSECSLEAFSPDGKALVVIERSSNVPDQVMIHAWDIADSRPRFSVPGFWGAKFTPDGKLLVARAPGPRGGECVKLWDATTGDEVGTLIKEQNDPYGFKISPDGRFVIYQPNDKTVAFWEIETNRVRWSDGGHIWGLGFSPNGGKNGPC